MTNNDRTIEHVCLPHVGASVWIEGYQQDCLMQKDEASVDAYLRILRQFSARVAKLPGQGGQFAPSQLTTTSVERICPSSKSRDSASATAAASKR